VSDDSIIVSKLFGSAATVPGTVSLIEVTFDHPAFINEEVRILMEWSGTAGDINNYLEFWATSSSVKASEHTVRYFGSYTLTFASDATYRYTYVAGEDGGSGGGIVYPTQAITRVTNMIHRYVRENGIFNLELQLGEVTTDFGIPQWLSRPQPAVAKTAEKQQDVETKESIQEAINEALTPQISFPGPAPAPPPVPGMVPTDLPSQPAPATPSRVIPRQEGEGTRFTPEHHRILTEQFEDLERLVPKGGGGVQEIQDLIAEIKAGAGIGQPETTQPSSRVELGRAGLARERARMRELRAQGLSQEEINKTFKNLDNYPIDEVMNILHDDDVKQDEN
ncbi:hypothetical protein LCGC14_2894500, partial [marine sediment metagenome]